MREQTGLARPGTRDDEHRPVGRDHRLALDRVQTLEQLLRDLPERVEIRSVLDVRSGLHESIVQVFARRGRVDSQEAAGARPEINADRPRSGDPQEAAGARPEIAADRSRSGDR